MLGTGSFRLGGAMGTTALGPIRIHNLPAAIPHRAKGDQSDLHIIIFDEIDAICKQRGSSRDGTGVHDTIVNQLLTKVGLGVRRLVSA